MDQARRKAIERVRALANMTVENGCTPEEQETATERARVVVERHALAYEEVAYDDPDVRVNRAPPEDEQAASGSFVNVSFTQNGTTTTARPYFGGAMYSFGRAVLNPDGSVTIVFG